MGFVNKIIEFNKSRNLSTFNASTEYHNLKEELEEFTLAISDNEEVDALCDIIVFSIGALYKKGYDVSIAMEETLKEITSRQGEINPTTGKWEKDVNQDPNTLYKADYTKARCH